MEERTCRTCQWLVEETDKVGEWKHEEALKQKKGFCLLKDLFTYIKPECKACRDYTK